MEDGLGESMEAKLQSIPSIGRVSVRRVDLINPTNSLYSERKWYITYISFIGNVPSAEIYSPKGLATNSSLLSETLVQGTAYYLTFRLNRPDGTISEAVTSGFRVEP